MTLSETCSTRCRRATIEQPNLRDEGSVRATRTFRERLGLCEGIARGRVSLIVLCVLARCIHDLNVRLFPD
jgi:hypothetical protein